MTWHSSSHSFISYPTNSAGHKLPCSTTTECDTANEHNSGLSMEVATSSRCCQSFAASNKSHRQCWCKLRVQIVWWSPSYTFKHSRRSSAWSYQFSGTKEEADRRAHEESQHEVAVTESAGRSRTQLLHPEPQAHLCDLPTHQQSRTDEIRINSGWMFGSVVEWSSRAVHSFPNTLPAIKRQSELLEMLKTVTVVWKSRRLENAKSDSHCGTFFLLSLFLFSPQISVFSQYKDFSINPVADSGALLF